MSGKESAAVERAVKRVLDDKESIRRAAIAEDVARSSVTRALKRRGVLPAATDEAPLKVGVEVRQCAAHVRDRQCRRAAIGNGQFCKQHGAMTR